MGCVIAAGLGQNVARQSALNAGLSIESPCTTINMVCGSGLKSVMLAAQAIATGSGDVYVAGRAESMSSAPYVLKDMRQGAHMGTSQAIDTMIHDALTDAFSGLHMGSNAETIARKYNISREDQDVFAAQSQSKAEAAQKMGSFKDEIIPISVPQKRGEDIIFSEDEYIRHGITTEKLSKLKPAFEKGGTVTAGNSSGINDGAAAIVVASEEHANKSGLKPMAKIVSYASAGVEPDYMSIGPVPASLKALEQANLTIEQIDLIEANEAFSAQAIAVARDLNFDMDKVNVNGGAIALGHPVGASGARILVTLIHELKRANLQYGLATLCVGGGMGVSMVVENCL